MSPAPITVLGVCTPERRRYAARLARAAGRSLVVLPAPPDRPALPVIEPAPPSLELDVADAAGPARGGGIIVDAPADLDVTHHFVSTRHAPLIVCVIDATHMVDDLRSETALLDRVAAGDDRGDVGARARQSARMIEAASLIALVNWENLRTRELSTLMALASHMNPVARIRLSRDLREDLRACEVATAGEATWQDRAGWMRAVNGIHDPHMTDPRVRTFRYERLRPFHPGRLRVVLDEEIEPGRCGAILRSAGFCRLATRSGILARWDHVGSAMWIDPLSTDEGLASTAQEIAFIGIDLDPASLARALDRALVTDDELAGGPEVWQGFADPLPMWPRLSDSEGGVR